MDLRWAIKSVTPIIEAQDEVECEIRGRCAPQPDEMAVKAEMLTEVRKSLALFRQLARPAAPPQGPLTRAELAAIRRNLALKPVVPWRPR
jgi:hypothetical protein